MEYDSSSIPDIDLGDVNDINRQAKNILGADPSPFSLAHSEAIAILSQRDIGLNISIDQNLYIGSDISYCFFRQSTSGFSTSTVDTIVQNMDDGLNNLVVHLYWNEYSLQWQLCPTPLKILPTISASAAGSSISAAAASPTAQSMLSFNSPISHPGETPTGTNTADTGTETESESDVNLNIQKDPSIINSDSDFTCSSDLTPAYLFNQLLNQIKTTNTNTQANLLFIDLVLESVYPEYRSDVEISEQNRLSSLASIFNPFLYTPISLQSDQNANLTLNAYDFSQSGWPSGNHTIFVDNDRVLVSVFENNLSSLNSYVLDSNDTSTIFNSSTLNYQIVNDSLIHECLYSQSEFINSQGASLIANPFYKVMIDDNMSVDISYYQQLAACGFSPVFNNSDLCKGNMTDAIRQTVIWSWGDNEPTSDVTGDNRCAIQTLTGWSATDCSSKLEVACRKAGAVDNDLWIIGHRNVSYFDGQETCSDLDHGPWYFSAPQTPLEQLALVGAIQNQNSNRSVWIDANSATVPDCWVTGGVNAQCPYEKRNAYKVVIYVPLALGLIVLFVFCLWIFIKLTHNRSRIALRQKRKAVRLFISKEYEGIPA